MLEETWRRYKDRGLIVLGVLLYQHQRAKAAWFMLVTVLVGGAYTAAFWNSTGSIGFAAQAIKTVIAPGQLSAQDLSSDLYRQIEAYDISPRIMNRAVSVQGAEVVIAALAGGSLLGLLGALIAIPVAASILIIYRQVVIPQQNER